MLAYKANLSTIHNRYGDLEERILEELAIDQMEAGAELALPGQLAILMERLVRDGILERFELPDQIYAPVGSISYPMFHGYRVTAAGKQLASNLRNAVLIE